MSVHGPPRLHFEPLKLLENFDFNADQDSALPSNADPDPDSKINEDPDPATQQNYAPLNMYKAKIDEWLV